MNTIQVRSVFYGWRDISYNDALNYAKWKLNSITTIEDERERLQIINNRLIGVRFNLEQLK